MKISLVLILLSFLIIQNFYTSKNKSITTDTTDLDCIPLDECIDNTDTIITNQQFAWSPDHPCQLGNYNAQGIIPAMRDSLIALSLDKRLTNGFNSSKASSNYHGADYTANGIDYSAAIDISVRCLSEDQIRKLLDELSMRGFAGWYRKNGEDGWNGDNHIHAIWVASPLKKQLVLQVKKWLAGKNGLTSDQDYKFWTPKPDALKRIRSAFDLSNPS